ncbi:MAG: hypothetical protein AAFV96_00835 [Pseudomonadota bacterium]
MTRGSWLVAALIALPLVAAPAGILAETGADGAQPKTGASTDWRQQIHKEDAKRLAAEGDAFATAVKAAFAGADIEQIAALSRAYAGPPRPATDRAILGDWECRIMKLGGGLLNMVIFSKLRLPSSAREIRHQKRW